MLAACPRLTSLHCCDSPAQGKVGGGASIVPLLAGCASLRRLSLVQPRLFGGSFRLFFMQPSIVTLEALELEGFAFAD